MVGDQLLNKCDEMEGKEWNRVGSDDASTCLYFTAVACAWIWTKSAEPRGEKKEEQLGTSAHTSGSLPSAACWSEGSISTAAHRAYSTAVGRPLPSAALTLRNLTFLEECAVSLRGVRFAVRACSQPASQPASLCGSLRGLWLPATASLELQPTLFDSPNPSRRA